MKFFSSIQLLLSLYPLSKSLAEKDSLKIKQSNTLRGESHDNIQMVISEDLTRGLRRQKDRGSRPIQKDSEAGRLRGRGDKNVNNEMDFVLYSKPVESLGVINGMISEEKRYKYMVTLTDHYGNHICGGSLIHNNLVLTAAHCNGYFSKAQIGRYNTANDSENYETFDVIGKVEHPEYHTKYLWNDVMIVVLSGKSTFPAITLHTKNQNIPEDLTVFGWGVTDPNGLPYRGPLLETNLKYISNSQCMLSTGFVDGIYGSYFGLIKDSNICADSDNSDSCFGDSGGPLIMKGVTSNDDIQVGIVSWGFGCNHPDFPGVYARIENQIDWIQNVVCILSSDHLSSNFDCARKQEQDRSSIGEITSCNPKRGCSEGFTCINKICVKDKNRNSQRAKSVDSQGTPERFVP